MFLIKKESFYKETESSYEKTGKIIAITGYLPGLIRVEKNCSCPGKIYKNRGKNRI